ncbi:hypothetical protein BC941DRAFT_468109 [Chlamydoabsidia padenii]|nr:hypothetical protein BC941DRAFT_468109 [Chlamydoabsidia padenii]
MDAFIHETETNIFADNDDPLFSLSHFDLELPQQAQVDIQQLQQQYTWEQQQQKLIQGSWQNFDQYLPIDCQSFVMNGSIPTNGSNMDFSTTDLTNYNKATPFTTIPVEQVSPSFDSSLTSDERSQWTFEDTSNQEYPSPAQVSTLLSSSQQSATTAPSLSSPTSQSNETNSQPLSDFTSQSPSSSSSMLPDGSDIIARINWEIPRLSNGDSYKVPFQRLQPINNNNGLGLAHSTLNSIGDGRKQQKTAHNAIERRYRNNINDRITELKNAVPALLYAKPNKDKDHLTTGSGGKCGRLGDDDDDLGEDGDEYLDGVAVATKLNKATILHKATEYINHLKRTGNDMKKENDSLEHLLAQLPGGQQVLAHYRIQKTQREHLMQQQMMMERQLQKQEQLNRKKEATRRKRTRRQSHDDDIDNGYLSSNSGGHPHTPPTATNRVFMALFMVMSLFSASPLATSSGSEQVNNHHHVSRTVTEQMDPTFTSNINSSTSTFYSQTTTNYQGGFSWFTIGDAWYYLRLVIFLVCLAQLLLPYMKRRLLGHAFRIRRINNTTKLRHHRHLYLTRKSKHLGLNNKASLSMSSGDEKCIQMHQLLTKLLMVEHGDLTSRLSSKNKFMLLLALVKELGVFALRHVLGYDITTEADSVKGDRKQHKLRRWGHVFKWIKLNECECLGGNPLLSRLTLLYHSLRMLNLVDSLHEELANDDDDDQGTRQQFSFLCARAYATSTIQMVMGIPYATTATRAADYLWGIAISHATEDDTWACLAEENNLETSLTGALSTNEAWVETLDVVQNQMATWTSISPAIQKKTMGLILSANAPCLVPTAILSNLHLLDQLALTFYRLIDSMIMNSPSGVLSFFTNVPSLSFEDDSQRLADWFACVGMTVEALWRHDIDKAEQYMLTLVHRVPRAMTVPAGLSKKKTRQDDLDTMAKQQVIHTLAGAVLLMKQDQQGIKELETAEGLRQRKNKTASFEAMMHIE